MDYLLGNKLSDKSVCPDYFVIGPDVAKDTPVISAEGERSYSPKPHRGSEVLFFLRCSRAIGPTYAATTLTVTTLPTRQAWRIAGLCVESSRGTRHGGLGLGRRDEMDGVGTAMIRPFVAPWFTGLQPYQRTMAVRPTPLVPVGCSLPAQHDQTVQTTLRDAEELE